MKKLVSQIFKFLVVGGIAFVIDYSLLFALTEFFKIHYLVSSVISFSVSVIFNYIASVAWVFEVDKEKNKVNNFILFIVLSIIGLLINQFVMWIGVSTFNMYYMIVKIIATAVVMVFNFITRKIFLE